MKFHESDLKTVDMVNRFYVAWAITHPSFFISKKVQVETPELEPGGNACNFIKILNYGKLEIGSRRDLRDIAVF